MSSKNGHRHGRPLPPSWVDLLPRFGHHSVSQSLWSLPPPPPSLDQTLVCLRWTCHPWLCSPVNIDSGVRDSIGSVQLDSVITVLMIVIKTNFFKVGSTVNTELANPKTWRWISLEAILTRTPMLNKGDILLSTTWITWYTFTYDSVYYVHLSEQLCNCFFFASLKNFPSSKDCVCPIIVLQQRAEMQQVQVMALRCL